MASLKKVINFIYSLLSIVGTIMIALAIATGFWRKSGSLDEGLWTACFGSSSNCSMIGSHYFESDTTTERFNAVRATLILAVLLQGCSVAVAILTARSERNYYPLLLIIEASSLTFALSGITVYAKNFSSPVLRFNWSFYVGLAGVCVNVLSFLLFSCLGIDRLLHCL